MSVTANKRLWWLVGFCFFKYFTPWVMISKQNFWLFVSICVTETHFTQDQGRHHDIRSQSGQVHGLQECHENLWSGLVWSALLCKVALVSHNTMWAIVLTCILQQHCSQGQNWSHLLQRARLFCLLVQRATIYTTQLLILPEPQVVVRRQLVSSTTSSRRQAALW